MARRDYLFIVLAFFSAGTYVALSSSRGAIGFPLDDAWIHQVYARNLATRSEFAFFPGQPSAGSTSPLWTIVLSLGYLLRIDFRAWAYLVDTILIGASAILVARIADRISGSSLITAYCSLFTIFEWHLAWSAVSGMEIPLFVFLSLFLVERYFANERAWFLGLIAALLTLTRPEGIVLAALVLAALSLRGAHFPQGGLRSATKQSPGATTEIASPKPLAMTPMSFVRVPLLFVVGFAVVIAPDLLFNFAVSGSVFPNTFYAKGAEYAELFERAPFIIRWLELLFVPFIGAQLLLIPGLLYGFVLLVQRKSLHLLIPFFWIFLLPALYALRLPVAYQHGRYEMPVIPFIVIFGVWGTAELLARLHRVIQTAWMVSTGVLLIAFWFISANAYATDVAIIDCEMVQTTRWVAANLPADALVAAHDIGALGYFYEKPFIDLAGLVSPEVIPFIRDEGRLREYLFSRNAQYAIFFPDWYPALASDLRFQVAHQQNCSVAREAGGTDLAVYEIRLTGR